MTLDKSYNPHAIEQRWYETWEANGDFRPSGEGKPYCIMLPPPNVTGTLHMGHAFQHTLMDTLTRYHRMRGYNTLWQTGTDHAGIATQMVVERQLNAENKTRHDLGREKFLQRVWQWKEESGGTITRQMRRLGDSTDWSRERFTMDEGLSEAVTDVFVQLFDEGLIYRGKRLVNWDPVLKTALSDLEVLSEEEQGSLWHLRYPLADGSGELVVATTRPETMLGDTAVAVHPEDERYQQLIGKEILLPLTGRRIPIIADDYVDREFGTGCVKITPAHDFNDYAIGQRHELPMINVLTEDGYIANQFEIHSWEIESDSSPVDSDSGFAIESSVSKPVVHYEPVPEAYRGLDRFEARKRVVADLDAEGFLADTEAHKLKVPRGDRSGAVVEPFLTDQWYVKIAPLAKPAIEAVESGKIRFVPENWSKTYFQWMHNIEDWCISRQLWWGHRIPAWYDADGKIYVGRDEADVRNKYSLGKDIELHQDNDVLDTWFSSALWPFSTLGWPADTEELKTFYPTSVLVTGFDIIFFWVARMIMMGLKFMDDVPFREIYITGLIRDEHGQKMSKSKGNVLDPIDIIDGIELEPLIAKRTRGMMQPQLAKKVEKHTRKQFPDGIKAHGTDALRFTFAALASPTRDINFDMGRVEGYRNFCNKLWNAARYVLMNTEGEDTGLSGELEFSLPDRWIRSRLAHTIHEVQTQLDHYRFDLAAKALYEFTWNEYCDWYLELAKPILQGEAPDAAKRGTRHTLVTVLEALLRLAHPLLPFITEEIWQRVAPLAGREDRTIMRQPFPDAASFRVDSQAEAEMDWVMRFILGIRRIRGEMDIAPGKPLPVLIANADAEDRERLAAQGGFLTTLARLESIEPLDPGADAPESAVALLGEMRILVPMAGLIDKDAELARLSKLVDKTAQDLERCKGKLGNEAFVQNAPEAVVNKERERVANLERELSQLREQREKIAAL